MNVRSIGQLIIICSLLGVIVGILNGCSILIIQNKDFLQQWELLDSSVNFIRIEANELSFPKIVAESKEEKYYTWECSQSNECQWIEIQNFELSSYKNFIQEEKSCNLLKQPPPKEPPDGVIECIYRSWHAGEGSGIDYYALLEDGKIWHWGTSSDLWSSTMSFFLSALLFPIIGIIFFSTVGLIAGIVYSFQTYRLNNKKM
jgi:hypothetical protein